MGLFDSFVRLTKATFNPPKKGTNIKTYYASHFTREDQAILGKTKVGSALYDKSVDAYGPPPPKPVAPPITQTTPAPAPPTRDSDAKQKVGLQQDVDVPEAGKVGSNGKSTSGSMTGLAIGGGLILTIGTIVVSAVG